MSFGSRLRKARLAKGWTQERFGNAFNPRYTTLEIRNWETNKAYPGVAALCQICTLLNVTPDVLLQDELAMCRDMDQMNRCRILGGKSYDSWANDQNTEND